MAPTINPRLETSIGYLNPCAIREVGRGGVRTKLVAVLRDHACEVYI